MKSCADVKRSQKPCKTCAKLMHVNASGYANCDDCRAKNPRGPANYSTTRCRTCENFLLQNEHEDGITRCRPCRKARPGRVLPNLNQARPKAASHISIVPSRRKTDADATATVSWWLDHPGADGFTARAEQETARMRATTKNRDHHGRVAV